MSKYKQYINLIKTRQDQSGFIESTHCDSLLFSGLVGCVPEVKVYIDDAMGEYGQWFRTPIYTKGQLDFTKECFNCEKSSSTISKDMLIGLLYFAYYNRRLDITEGLIRYALRNLGIMGKAKDLKTLLSRCLISPGLLGTAAWISYRLGGPSRPWLRLLPMSPSKHVTGFQAHLAVLHILLKNKLTNENNYKDILNYHYNRQPNNPLFAIASGHHSAAKAILANPKLWPDDRLPTNRDRAESWLVQRDFGPDWKPQTDKELTVHSGGDYLFLIWLLSTI